MRKDWIIKKTNPQEQVKLCNALKIDPIVAQILLNRHIHSTQEAGQFLKPDLSSLQDPFLLKGMKRAVERIRQAKEKKENVLVFGDYDVDGVTSAVLLNKILKDMGIKVLHQIPHRMKDGYGLHDKVVQYATKHNVRLVITVDCGITAEREVQLINDSNINVIIIDHHEPKEGHIPQAYSIINPKQKDCPYPFKEFASVGLVAKLAQALQGKLDEDLLDLVAIGTVADIVPLRMENRVFVKYGLGRINQTNNKGLMALLDVTKIKGKKLSPYHIGFILGPRINAAGRMDTAQSSLDLFLSDDMDEAYSLAKVIDGHNTLRQKTQRDVVQEAFDIIDQEVNFKDQKVIVLGKEGWHKGVLGVASKITEKYYRPSIVISVEDGVGTASARSIDGFHLHEALLACAGHLEEFGGHEGAAGLRIKEENIDSFRNLINKLAENTLQAERLIPSIEIDCEIPLESANMDLAQMVDDMEPFGEGNPIPLFCSRKLIVKGRPQVLGKNTLKFWVTNNKYSISAVGFGMAEEYYDLAASGAKIDLAYQVTIDDWNKSPQPQLRIEDIRLSE